MKRLLRSSLFQWAAFLVIIGVLWAGAALAVSNPIILPSPWQVLLEMKRQLLQEGFALSMLLTIARALAALASSFVLAMPAAFLAVFYPAIRGFLNRLVSVMQTVPNVCYIILLLFWTSREQTVILTGFFLLFPICYRSFYEQLITLVRQWKPVWMIYPQPRSVLMVQICLPMLRPSFSAALKSASSLAFKACVTSEILTGLAPGIGKSMQLARLDLNLAGVFAWSVWLVLLVFLFEQLWNRLVLAQL